MTTSGVIDLGSGRIQQVQSFSTVDGPGTRSVVFLQGCPVSCLFCHNPDSWDRDGGEVIEVDQLLRRLERFRPFLSSKGLTISGGEPLFQPDFTIELAQKARDEGWHVALDTSGWGTREQFIKVAKNFDLVLFSIKHPLAPESVSRCRLEAVMDNLESLAELKIPLWLRYVLIPGWTNQPDALAELRRIVSGLPNLQKVEILPYNSLAENKWKKLGWDSPLFHDVSPVTEGQIKMVEEFIAFTPK